MSLDSDKHIVRLVTPDGPIDCPPAAFQIESWPPPNTIRFDNQWYACESYSEISDELLASSDHLMRGAIYRPINDTEESNESDRSDQ